jgi:hypothetical protein
VFEVSGRNNSTERRTEMLDTKLTGRQRFTVVGPLDNGSYALWDHEDAERITDADGRETFSQRDAHDLREEYIYS